MVLTTTNIIDNRARMMPLKRIRSRASGGPELLLVPRSRFPNHRISLILSPSLHEANYPNTGKEESHERASSRASTTSKTTGRREVSRARRFHRAPFATAAKGTPFNKRGETPPLRRSKRGDKGVTPKASARRTPITSERSWRYQ